MSNIIDLHSNKQESILVIDPANGRKTAVSVTAFADKEGNVTIDVDTLGNGASLIICQDGNILVDQTI